MDPLIVWMDLASESVSLDDDTSVYDSEAELAVEYRLADLWAGLAFASALLCEELRTLDQALSRV